MSIGIGLISALAVGGVIFRPFGWPEWIFALVGAIALVATGLLTPSLAIEGIFEGTDVYLFLAGMMLLAEIARKEGLFTWLAGLACRLAAGSPWRLFSLVYLVGTLVTVFLSNDATAVVLTPAVIAVVRAAEAEDPIPYLLICAFVANAASFVLPISNPANIVIFGDQMPPLGEWLARFAWPSAVAIAATFALLALTQRRRLVGTIRSDAPDQPLTSGAQIAAFGLVIAIAVLMTASALDVALGLPTALAGLATLALVSIVKRKSPLPALAGISWTTLILVAGLFVIVEALDQIGLETQLVSWLGDLKDSAGAFSEPLVGAIVAVLTNLTNNLPLGLLAGHVVASGDTSREITDAILIGIDLGPNLSVTGSLATILWLLALRREGLSFRALDFLRIGAIVMPPTLILTLWVAAG
ncbi:MAG: arsenic transporter [Fulvimarina manganoxydans]|uniref:arsenic transporter n=1 Tax=Fulvimarina manganoxydans TaxID=937218 RepID=UPI002352AF86|nr:arsenic transporter [Fulvimarina manganoxydans]MCK5931600.1 arsenic transporter [Fulvimarina manganoxydans]